LKILNQRLLSSELLSIERTDYNFSQRQILDGLNISDSFYKTLSSLKKMLVPVRCFTCGNLVANKHAEYSARIKAGEDPGKVMDSLNIKRYCCRRMFTSTVETIYQVIPYYEALRRRMSEIQSEME
jgi:DNA-directed RNA polymerase subunit N